MQIRKDKDAEIVISHHDKLKAKALAIIDSIRNHCCAVFAYQQFSRWKKFLSSVEAKCLRPVIEVKVSATAEKGWLFA